MRSASITERQGRRAGLRWRAGTAVAALALLVATPSVVVSADAGRDVRRQAPAAAGPLTNLAHLDWLSVPVDPPTQAGHTTYRLAQEPEIGVPWTYADARMVPAASSTSAAGVYDPDTSTWGQGAFNADDISRAAVVYLRHWQADALDRTSIVQGVRAAPRADLPADQDRAEPRQRGALDAARRDSQPQRRSARASRPVGQRPSPTGWRGRSGRWARDTPPSVTSDPAFASFLRNRLNLAVGAVNRQVLDRYGDHLNSRRRAHCPAWLIVDGADATAEAILGLRRMSMLAVRLTCDAPGARPISEGVADLSAGTRSPGRSGPFCPGRCRGRVARVGLPDAGCVGARHPSRLATPLLARAAARDSFSFDPWLLTSGGPDNGRMPDPRSTCTQIAYGVDSRVQSLIATAEAAGSVRARRWLRFVAAWFFGANPAGEPMYNPATGRRSTAIVARRLHQSELRRRVDHPWPADDDRLGRAPTNCHARKDGDHPVARRHHHPRSRAGRDER